MAIAPNIREIFGRFQNLNLLALLADLRDGQVAHNGWLRGDRLCPVAHGLSTGRQAKNLKMDDDLRDDCWYASRQLGADADAILEFVRAWDEETLRPEMLYRQLADLWHERLADAIAVQDVLEGMCPADIPEEEEVP
jgi:hypothetical protein